MALLRTVLADSPSGYWPVDEDATAATAFDRSGTAADCTWNGTRTGSTLLTTPCGTCSGDDSLRSALVSAFDLATSDVTFELVCRFSGAGTTLMTPYMVRNDNGLASGTLGGFLFSNAVAGRVELYDGASIIAGASAGLNDGNWHHVAGVLPVGASATHRIYVDGVQAASATATRQSVGSSTRRMCLGSNWSPPFASGAFQFYTGDVAHGALYPSVLSAARIKLHSDDMRRLGVTVG